jgi:hypothetical protein
MGATASGRGRLPAQVPPAGASRASIGLASRLLAARYAMSCKRPGREPALKQWQGEQKSRGRRSALALGRRGAASFQATRLLLDPEEREVRRVVDDAPCLKSWLPGEDFRIPGTDAAVRRTSARALVLGHLDRCRRRRAGARLGSPARALVGFRALGAANRQAIGHQAVDLTLTSILEMMCASAHPTSPGAFHAIYRLRLEPRCRRALQACQ